MTRRRTGWLLYAVLLTAFVILGELSNARAGRAVTAIAVSNWILTAALLTATWCYALQKPFGAARYWRTTFWIVLFATAVMLVPVILGDPEVIVFTALLLALVVPAYLAAFRYAYRSPQLWRTDEESRS